jgi:serine/threonine protein kinase
VTHKAGRSEDSNPRRFAGYDLVSRVEVDGGAATYKALQVALGRPVLVTVLPADAARQTAHRTRFERQVQIASRLSHENVISAIDAGEFKGCRYFVTEYVEGRTLAEELKKRRGPLHVERAVGIARDVARALAYLESVRLVHRNVTPESIHLTDHGPAKLSGFAAAKDHAPNGSETWVEHDGKSARYLAPEFLRGERGIDGRSDIYSLGCVLYHMVTGLAPFDAKSAAVVLESHATRPPTDPREFSPDLPNALVEVLDRCLRKKREHRYAKAEDLARDLDAVRVGLPIGRHKNDGALWTVEKRQILPRIRRSR